MFSPFNDFVEAGQNLSQSNMLSPHGPDDDMATGSSLIVDLNILDVMNAEANVFSLPPSHAPLIVLDGDDLGLPTSVNPE